MNIKRIETREHKEKREGRNKLIIGVVLVALLVVSTAGYAFYSGGKVTQSKKLSYNGVEFSLRDNRWYFEVDGYEFSTLYSPLETENLSAFLTISLQNYMNKPVYISYDSNRESVQEIIWNLDRFIERTQYVCLIGEKCEDDLVEKNCSDNIIVIKNINKTIVRQEENCVYLISPAGEALKIADYFIFKILGIQ